MANPTSEAIDLEVEIGGVPASDLLNALVARLLGLAERGQTAAGKAAVALIREIQVANAGLMHRKKLDALFGAKAFGQLSEYLGYIGVTVEDAYATIGAKFDPAEFAAGQRRWRVMAAALHSRRTEVGQ